jgi:hypothetical protein
VVTLPRPREEPIEGARCRQLYTRQKTAASIPTASIQRIREPQRIPTSNPGKEKQVTGPPAAT